MTDLTLESLADRLARLERQNRRLAAAAVLLVAVLAAAVCMGQVRAPNVVEAESFVVRDAAGKARAALFLGEEGPALALSDQNGKLRAALRVDNNGLASLAIFDDKGQSEAVPTISADQLLTPEQRGMLRILQTEFAPELRRINNALADVDDRLVEVEDWIAQHPPPAEAAPKQGPEG